MGENKNISTGADNNKSIIFDKTMNWENLIHARKKEGQGLTNSFEKLSSIMELHKDAEKILPERSKSLKKNFKSAVDKVILKISDRRK